MKFSLTALFLLLICSFVKGQVPGMYSETASDGLIIQNSFPRGGAYEGPVKKYFSVSNWNERGGNRAELVLKGQDLYYRMPPQIDSLHCGRIVFIK